MINLLQFIFLHSAKKRVNDARSARSSLPAMDVVQMHKSDPVSECGDSSRSCNGDVLPDSGGSSSYPNNERVQEKSPRDYDSQLLGGVDVSKDDQKSGSDQHDSSECSIQKPEVPDKLCSSIEIAGNENGKLADNEIEELADNENGMLADNKIEVVPDNEIEDLADNENGKLANNEIEVVADNEIEISAENEIENLADNENKGFADNGSQGMVDNENKGLADIENEKLLNGEYKEFACKENEGFTQENGHFTDDKDEESDDNDYEELPAKENEGFAHENGHFSDSKSEESEDNENEEFACKENKGSAHENGHFADNENEESKDNEFVCKKNEEFALQNGHVTDNENEESEDNENEKYAHNEIKDFAPNENEECKVKKKKEINEYQEFSRKKNDEFASSKNEVLLTLARRDLKGAENKESSSVTEANMVDINRKSGSNLGSSSNVKLVAAVGNGISSDTLVSSPSEQLEQPQISVHQDSGHVRSIRTSESMEFNPSSELSDTLRNMSKSSTVRSSHAYDGSVSSYDGIDDQLPNPQMHSFQDTYKASHFVHSGERSRRDKFLVKSMTNENSHMQHPARNSLSDKKKHVLNYSNWDQDEFLGPARYGHKIRNRTRLDRDKYQPGLSFPQMGLQAGYENGSSSSQLHDEFHHDPGFQSSDLSEDLEQDKMKLMRMIFELQNQLNKTLSLREMGYDGISEPSRMSRYVPRYNNYDAPEEERLHPSNYPRYGRIGARSSYSQDHRSMQVPFSGETTSSEHQFDPSCLHRHPPKWQRSAQLPLPLVYPKNKRCRIHPGHNCCTSYNSCPSSPQRFMDTEFPLRGYETMSEDQRRKSHEVRSYLREKPHLVKRHLRPIASGAPFITCYKCSKLLQLPADFLLFKRKSHRLRCGACSEVLKFSLRDGSHIVPYTLIVSDPPPSEVEDCCDAIDRRNFPSTSKANDHFLQADPVSCSDDYGLSYCQSWSTEGDLVSSYYTPRGSMDERRVSTGSFDPKRDWKGLASGQSRNNYKKSMLRYESGGTSSNISKVDKFSSEIERLPRTTGSPLHRLMGYSSPSQVIRGSEASGNVMNRYSVEDRDREKFF